MSTQSRVGRVWRRKPKVIGILSQKYFQLCSVDTIVTWHQKLLCTPSSLRFRHDLWWSRILIIKDYDDQGGLTRVPAIQTGSQIRQIGTSPNLCRGRTAPLSSSPTYITAKPTDIPDTSNLIWSSTLKCLGRFWAVSQVVQILGSWSSGGKDKDKDKDTGKYKYKVVVSCFPSCADPRQLIQWWLQPAPRIIRLRRQEKRGGERGSTMPCLKPRQQDRHQLWFQIFLILSSHNAHRAGVDARADCQKIGGDLATIYIRVFTISKSYTAWVFLYSF